MKQLRYILVAFTCIFVLFACKKDKTSCPPPTGGQSNCENIQNVKHFFYFKVGSWWVYEEETSGDLDTISITEASHDPTSYNFDVRVYSTNQDYYYHYWSVIGASSQNCVDFGTICGRCMKVKRSKYKPGEFVNEATCFIFLPIVGESDYNYNIYYPNNYVYVDSVWDEYTLDTLSFIRTIRMHELNTFMEGAQPTNHYFSENVGLIRKELLDSNKVWNLVDYYIQN